ncbi:hypothetical protein B296_00037902, partial [Ensete ventricosum]
PKFCSIRAAFWFSLNISNKYTSISFPGLLGIPSPICLIKFWLYVHALLVLASAPAANGHPLHHRRHLRPSHSLQRRVDRVDDGVKQVLITELPILHDDVDGGEQGIRSRDQFVSDSYVSKGDARLVGDDVPSDPVVGSQRIGGQ